MSVGMEIPTVFEPWSSVQWFRRTDSDLEAMMGALPFHDQVDSWDVVQPLREAVVDCLDQLSEEDRFVIDALWFEGITIRVLAVRLGIHKSRTHRIAVRAVARLGVICADHPLIAARLAG